MSVSWGQPLPISGPYSQNFNSLSSSTSPSGVFPSGWATAEVGSGANNTYSVGTGSSNAGDTYSFGLSNDADRALGSLRSGSVNPVLGAHFTNNSGATITSITISYVGEQWRLGTSGRTIPDRMDFQYSTVATCNLCPGPWIDVDQLDFTAPITSGTVGALNGNLPENRTTVTHTITGLSIPVGGNLYLRWLDFDASGADDGLAIDDFTMSFTNPPATPNGGIYESYAILSTGGNNTYYDLNTTTSNPDFQGANLGTFSTNQQLLLNGGESKTFECTPTIINNSAIFFRVYPNGGTPGDFQSISLAGPNPISGAGAGCQNKFWSTSNASVNLLNGLCTNGLYVLEVFMTADYTGAGAGTFYASNDSNNYKATFTVNNITNSGIYESYVLLDAGSGTTYYDVQANTGNPDFAGSLGNFCATGGVLTLKGGQNNTYKCGNNDITFGTNKLFYRVYPGTTATGNFIEVNLSNDQNIGGAGVGCQNQSWLNNGLNTNLLNGLAAGTYTLEVYSQAGYTFGGTCPSIHYASNGGANYKATFTVVAPAFTATPTTPVTAAAAANCQATVNYTVTAVDFTLMTYAFSGATPGSGNGSGSGSTFNKGTTTVTVSIQSSCGMQATAFDVVVNDMTPPTAVCQNIAVNLNAQGQATITPQMVDNGSSDNCGPVTLTLNKTNFTCADVTIQGLPVPTDLFISEYVEGSSNNKYIEIYNGTPNAIDLGAYELHLFSNGVASPTTINVLSGNLASGATIVYRNSSANIYGGATVVASSINFNGDDAFALFKNGQPIDVIGQIGVDPGTEWNNNGVSTLDRTLRRKNTIVSGDTNGSDPFDPSAEWDSFPIDTVDGLGSHAIANSNGTPVTLTVSDGVNTSTCQAFVTVNDVTPPTFTTALNALNRTVECGNTNALNDALALAPQGTDTCGSVTITLDSDDITPGNGNTYTRVRIWKLTDASGNPALTTYTQTITVQDTTAPTAVCQNITVNLSPEGIAIITPQMVDNGSADGCGPVTVAVSPTTFTCTNVGTSSGIASDLFISEYVEGSSNNKYIEIYNGTGSSVNLANYSLRNYANGSTSFTSATLSGTLANGATVVYRNTNATIYAGASTVLSVINFNGNDVVALFKGTSPVDIIGQIGNDPGTSWSANGVSTVNQTLRRKSNITVGDTNGADAFDPSLEWDSFPEDTVSGLGSHTITPGPLTTPVTLTVTDASGNITSCQALVTVLDVTAPEVTTPPNALNVTLQCSDTAGVTAALAMAPQGTDACGTPVVVLTSDLVANGIGNAYVRTRTWVVKDASGNQSLPYTQVITVIDTENPTWTNEPVNQSIECLAGQPNANTFNSWLTGFSGTDSCGNATVTNNYNGPAITCANPGTATVTFTLTDANGNSIQKTATFTLFIQAPTFASITQTTAECDNPNSQFALTGLLANATVTLVYTINGGAEQSINGVTASAAGTATVTIPLPSNGDGQTLTVVRLVRTDVPGVQVEPTTGNTVVIEVNNSTIWYEDADNDGFGNPNVTIQDCDQPAGYIAVAGDCNDNDALINPGASEICFDGIDNNCDGSLFTGCTPIVVNITSNVCGSVNNGLNNTIQSSQVNLGSGYVIGYRFEVTNTETGEVRTIDRNVHHFKLTMFGDDFYSYGTTYAIRVAAIINGEVQPYNGTTCNITTTSVGSTSIVAAQCGSTLATMSSSINAVAVNPTPIKYRFRVARADAPTTFYYVERTVPNFNLTMVAGLPLTFGTQYLVAVQIRVKLAGFESWSQWSAAGCSVYTPEAPTTSLTVAYCEYVASSNADLIYATPLPGATMYRFLLLGFDFDANNEMIVVYEQYVDTPNPYFSLSMFTGLVPGLNYSVSVAAQLFGTFTPYGKECSVTTPGGARNAQDNNNTAPNQIPLNFKATANPNPYEDSFVLQIQSNSSAVVQYTIYDMTGRLLETKEVNHSELQYSRLGMAYPSGIYNVIVVQEDQTQTIRMVKK
ncbi:hypothetical protein GCM10011343_02340 [Flavobacterium orientale]|uniref:Por secretion system C-terminal sorting domain-containing protein n=1 Tax=Flavobacterium orientale TaxID=1756020 RepID=A0A917D9Q2_9FLAO|nr:hypothetical protein GCM10011343_02340 [Flavobacterium orientale]